MIQAHGGWQQIEHELGAGNAAMQTVLGWACVLVVPALLFMVWALRRRLRAEVLAKRNERRRREELEAYERIDPSLTPGMAAGANPVESMRELAKKVCRTITEKSVFPSAAMLLRDAEGKLYCAGRAGVDDLTIAALLAWGEGVVNEERNTGGARISLQAEAGTVEATLVASKLMASKVVRTGAKSFTIPLGEWDRFDPEVSRRALEGKRERRRWRRSIIVPMRTPGGQLAGVIAVCADDSSRRAREWTEGADSGQQRGLERVMGPIEALTVKLGTAMENAALANRLLRAEKLAGLGQLAGGVAHALNNPLTAVLGFAELIEETSHDPRVRTDARTIVTEAQKMRETVQSLLNFWRPVTLADEPVQLTELVGELTEACSAKLAERGVKLIVSVGEEVPLVRGSRERLRQVLEHLLNNAAQAIAAAKELRRQQAYGRDGRRLSLASFESLDEPEIEHTIRMTISHDGGSLHVIVSDTGTGFAEPGRVFDPFYTTRQPGEGAGLGLSICYGIVREHGGEISAFNLHPQGAAVVIELPVRRVVNGDSVERVLVRDVA